MRYSTAHMPQEVSFKSKSGVVIVPAAPILGILHIEGFIDPPRHVDRDRGLLEINFCPVDDAGNRYRHFEVLPPSGLWPSRGIEVRSANGLFKKEITLKVVLDTRDFPALSLAGGEKFQSAHKYNDLTFQLRADESSIAVRLTVYIGDITHGKEDSYRSFDYDIPLAQLLWRKAPKYTDDDVSPESEDFVHFERIGHISDPGTPKELRPSPIRVVG